MPQLADPEMIVMRGVDDDFSAQGRIASAQPAVDVRRLDACEAVVELDRRRDARPNRHEVAAPRGGHERVEVLSVERRQRSGRRFGDPALPLDPGLVAGGQFELLTRPRGLHGLERVARGRPRVDDDRACGTLPCGALVLVVPAAVVQASVAPEERRIPVRVEHDLGVPDRHVRDFNAAGGDVLVPPLQ
jgi:hypothetical protein